MLSNDLMARVKSTVGTCQAMGLLIDSKEIEEINKDVSEGKYDAMISAGKTEVDAEKRAELDNYFKELHAKQDATLKAEAEAAAAEAESKAAATEGAEAAPEEAAPEEKKE